VVIIKIEIKRIKKIRMKNLRETKKISTGISI